MTAAVVSLAQMSHRSTRCTSAMTACRCALRTYAIAEDTAPMTCASTGVLSR